jgi:hypothetical protein
MARQITNTARPRFAGRTIVHPIHPPGTVGTSFLFCVSARFLEPASTSENVRCWNPTSAKVCRDRVGNYSDRQTAAPTGSALLTRSSRSSSVACATCWKRHIACKLPHEEHQFSATISETRFSHRRRPHASIDHAAGAAAVMTREAGCWLLVFNSVRANVSTTYRISFACTQGRIETE